MCTADFQNLVIHNSKEEEEGLHNVLGTRCTITDGYDQNC